MLSYQFRSHYDLIYDSGQPGCCFCQLSRTELYVYQCAVKEGCL